VCLSQIPTLVKTNPILVAASLVVGTSKVTNFITGLVSHPPFLLTAMVTDVSCHYRRCFGTVGNVEGKQLWLS